MLDQAKVQFLAGQFADVVHDWTDEAEFAEIKRRNATPKYVSACASHDFIDANMAMEQAFRQAFGRSPLPDDADEMSDDDLEMWNAAWAVAKTGWLTA